MSRFAQVQGSYISLDLLIVRRGVSILPDDPEATHMGRSDRCSLCPAVEPPG